MDIDRNEDDIAGALREAFNEQPEVVEERARDESGKFTAKADGNDSPVEAAAKLEPEAPVVESQPAVDAPQTLSADRPPSSWTPAAREKWAAIDPDIRNEIIRREEASMNGVRQMQERFAPMQQVMEQLQPVAVEAQQIGTDPVSYVHSLVQSERALRTADMPTKFNELLRIADQYGIPLRDVINKSVGQEVLKAPQQNQMQIPPEFQQELAEIRNWRYEQEQQQINYGVKTFGQDKEFFNDVRNVMADLIERGMAADVPSAYDQACWMVPEVRQVMLARQGQPQAQVTQRQQAAAAASMPAGGKINVKVDEDSDDDDIGATVRNAFNRAATGRV